MLRFVIINSLLLNSGLPDEQKQKLWLEDELAQAGDRRVFLFMHYPPYIYSTDERGNYDNVDEPSRSWLLSLMQKPQVEAVFAGHVHNFWYDRVGAGGTLHVAFNRLLATRFFRVLQGSAQR